MSLCTKRHKTWPGRNVSLQKTSSFLCLREDQAHTPTVCGKENNWNLHTLHRGKCECLQDRYGMQILSSWQPVHTSSAFLFNALVEAHDPAHFTSTRLALGRRGQMLRLSLSPVARLWTSEGLASPRHGLVGAFWGAPQQSLRSGTSLTWLQAKR